MSGRKPENTTQRLKRYCAELGSGNLHTNGKVINCLVCECPVGSADRKSQVKQHVESEAHKSAAERSRKQPKKTRQDFTDLTCSKAAPTSAMPSSTVRCG